jgi:hypothetical protein
MSLKDKVRDYLALALFFPVFPFLRFAGPRRGHLHAVRGLLDRAGVAVLPYHYYEPIYKSDHIFRDPDRPRQLAGIDWNRDGQARLIAQFNFGEALRAVEGRSHRGHVFRYDNGMFGPGDAEALYCMIRHFKPRRIVEIGCGQSTLVAHFAIADAMRDDPAYRCRQLCFEPFENPWLDDLGVEVVRQPIERADLAVFRSLSAGDIVFIDSSHVLRTMGDVEFEYLHILPILPPGVIVHVHDIFSPRDYPRKWLSEDRRFWNEQYLLEAFLAFNGQFEILCAMNDQMQQASPAFRSAFPVLAERGDVSPVGSFWFRRKLD